MPNRVALLRAEIEAAHPGARLKHRGEAGFSMRLPSGVEEHRYTTGPWHWRQTDEPWQEIDTDLQAAGDPDWQWQVRSARFDTLLRPDGSRRFYPRRWVTDEWVEWGVPEWRAARRWEALPVAGKKMQNRLVAAGEAVYEVGHTGRGSRTSLVIPHEGLARPLRWPVTFQGLHDQDGVLVSDRDGVPVGWLRSPWMQDQDGQPQLVPWQFKAGRLLLDPDYAGLRFPVVVDPDYAIAAGADDGYCSSAGIFGGTEVYLTLGVVASVSYHSWMRFAAIAADQAADCSAASIAFVSAYTRTTTTMLTDFYGVDEDDHVAPTTYSGGTNPWTTDHGIHTAATVAWDSIGSWTAGTTYTSPDLSAILDELFARGGWATGQDIGVHWDDGGSTNGASRLPASYENTSYTEPVLSLTLTPAETNDSTSPACLTTTSTFPAVTTKAGGTTSPACLTTGSTFGTVTVQAGISLAVACLLTLSTFAAPTLAAGQTVSPACLSTASTFPAVTTTGAAAVSPDCLATGSTFPAVTLAAGQTTSPACLTTASEFPAATLAAGQTTSPACLTTGSVFPSVTVTAAQQTTPDCLTTISAFPAVTLAAGATANPDCLTTVSEFPAVTFTQAQTTSPACLTTGSTFPAVTHPAGAAVQPDCLTTGSTFPAVTTTAGTTTSPATLTTGSTFPTPTVAAGQTSSPNCLTTGSTFPAPTVVASVTPTPDCLTTGSSFPAVTLTAGGTTSPACLTTTSTFPAPTVRGWYGGGPAIISDETTAVTSSEPSTTVTSRETTTVTNIARTQTITGHHRPATIKSEEPL